MVPEGIGLKVKELKIVSPLIPFIRLIIVARPRLLGLFDSLFVSEPPVQSKVHVVPVLLRLALWRNALLWLVQVRSRADFARGCKKLLKIRDLLAYFVNGILG